MAATILAADYNEKAAVPGFLCRLVPKGNIIASFHRLHNGKIRQNLDVLNIFIVCGIKSTLFQEFNLCIDDFQMPSPQ